MKFGLFPLLTTGLLAAAIGCDGGAQKADSRNAAGGAKDGQPPASTQQGTGDSKSNDSAENRGRNTDAGLDSRWSLILFRTNRAPAETPPSKLGFSRLTRQLVGKGDQSLVKQTMRLEMSANRSGSVTSQWQEYTSFDTPDGRLIRFESMQSLGRGTRVATGRVVGNELRVDVVVSAGGGAPQQESSRIAWQDAYGGYFAVEDSLRRQPLKPGEKRLIKYVDPTTNLLSTAALEGFGYEQVGLLDGSRTALHGRRIETIGKTQLVVHFWCDEKGEVLKGRFEGTGMEQYLTTKDVATGPWKAPQIDFAKAMMIGVREIKNPHDTREVVYRARLKGKKDAARFFPTGRSQSVTSNEDGSARIVVRRLRPGDGLKGATDRRPRKEDLESNGLIQSDDAQIRALAETIAVGEKDKWKTACAMEKHVFKRIEKKTMTQAFATAAEVLQTSEGDCTEHAVLLAALCRARQIPARVAIGLVYFVGGAEKQPQMAYHMWTEVHVGDGWIPLDATLGRGGIGGAHLKVADSSLAGTSGFSAMLPLLHVANQLELEIETAE